MKHCNDCHQPIVFFVSPFDPGWRPFNPDPVNGRTHQGATAFPVDGRKAYRLRDLIEELMVRRRCSSTDANDEAYDVDWYVLHACPERTT